MTVPDALNLVLLVTAINLHVTCFLLAVYLNDKKSAVKFLSYWALTVAVFVLVVSK